LGDKNVSAKEHSKRAFIIVIVLAFVISSIGFTGLVIWELTRDKSQTNDVQKQLEEQLSNQQQENQMDKQPLTGYNSEPFDKASITSLKVETLKKGSGTAANPNSTVRANYFGWTSDGKIFDSSQKGTAAEPIEFPLSGVIKGWTQGLSGVPQGSVIKLSIPANLAYGEQGSPPVIGPNEPLVFIIELVEVK
jgi:FKBP-type peptidyl-prolyl cis-trans isomerase FkpA